MYDHNDYQLNYQNLPFEDKLRKFRMQYLLDYIATFKHSSILEIGCGNDPLFELYDDYKIMDVVEPGNHFYSAAVTKSKGDPRISIYHGVIEQCSDQLKNNYDLILIGGFLHEIDNAPDVLAVIKKLAGPHSVVVTYVPNSNSFHRLLALESGFIKAQDEFSQNDTLFGRRKVYDVASFSGLFVVSGYSVIKADTYFVKPFTHEQMDAMMGLSQFTQDILIGLYKMTKYFPDAGCEIFLAANIISGI